MGVYSWLDCITEEPILIGEERTAYVLVPDQFGGGHIANGRYGGYGYFGGYDIYELVLEWNKDYIPQYVELMKAGKWKCKFNVAKPSDLMNYYVDRPVDAELRDLGILLACYDEDNERLQYPIKITFDPNATYEECGPSKSDPYQGCDRPTSGNVFFGVSATLPVGDDLDDSAVEQLVLQTLESEITTDPTITIRDAVALRLDDGFIDPYEEEAVEYYPDDEFTININCTLSNVDDDQYIASKFYEVFEAARYEIRDVYYERTDY